MRDRGLLKGLSILLAAGLPLAAAPRLQADDRGAASESHRSHPDSWLTLKAKTKMLTTEGLPVSTIHVDTLNGVVTLYGTVASQEEKARAEKEVRELEGVRGVRNQLKVSGEAKSTARASEDRNVSDRGEGRRSDDEIRRQAERTLKSDRSLAGSSVTVRSVDNGVVTLAGRAESDADQYRALRDISGLPGVKHVANEIQVTGESGTRADTGANAGDREHMDSGRRTATRATGDAWITTDVKSRLIADGKTPAMDINVDTYDGVVTLFGMVPSQEAKAAAEADAHKVNGVRRVVNELQVVPKPEQKQVQAKDDDLKSDVKRALDEKGIRGVDVEVKNGVVRLTGNMESAQDSLTAGFCARSVAGVRSVQNEIHLKNDDRNH